MARFWKEAATVILAGKFPRKSSTCISSKRLSEYAQNWIITKPSSSECEQNTGRLTETTSVAPDEFDYKVLMLKRSGKSSFMPSAYVFPGGRISDSDFLDKWCELFHHHIGLKDYTLAGFGIEGVGGSSNAEIQNSQESELEESAPRLPMFEYHDGRGRNISSELGFRISAVRETFEESGILLCTNKKRLGLIDNNDDSLSMEASLKRINVLDSCIPVEEVADRKQLAQWRAEVQRNEHKFVEMCAELEVVPNVWCFFDWSCWLTPSNMPQMHGARRFDTAFYLACLPAIPATLHDDMEVVSSEWTKPLDILCRHYAEELWLAPPQIYELCRLCSKPQLEDLLEFAKERQKLGWERWLPVRMACEDGSIAVLPGDELYPEEPDWPGTLSAPTFPLSISEMRSSTISHHRFEFFGPHHTSIACTEPQRYGHLSPNPGHLLWEAVREQYRAAQEDMSSSSS